ncbi:MAG: hypothetical protein RLZZ200_2945 [Pseudomonadota bacterium]|jgi:hypothetical protein
MGGWNPVDMDTLNDFERGWITGWLRSRGISRPTRAQFAEALFAMLDTPSGDRAADPLPPD